MATTIEFFPVDNGDMTLLTTESDKKILIDIHIRQSDELEESVPNVIEMLRERLMRDENNHLYVDVFLLTHPDEDHILGLSEYFHLGPIEDLNEDDDKIIIREMWSSPIIFRRKTKLAEKNGLTLCDDAQAWWTEARRRVNAFRVGFSHLEGNRILILGDDIDEKLSGLEPIRVQIGNSFGHIGGIEDGTVTIDLLGPLPQQRTEDEEDVLAKNRSSIITRFHLSSGGNNDACVFLSGGDAEVFVWEKLWEMYKGNLEMFSYDLLQAPHHCSFHSMSGDSWSEMGEKAAINLRALNALSQAKNGATIVASCKPISADDSDPPCVGAEREYQNIVKKVGGRFVCTMTHQGVGDPEVLLFNIGGSSNGGSRLPISSGPVTPTISRLDPPTREFDKEGGGRYA